MISPRGLIWRAIGDLGRKRSFALALLLFAAAIATGPQRPLARVRALRPLEN